MSYTKIAHAAPFEGAPAIHLPAVYGASPDMPMLLRVPVTGERPVTVTAELPAGLSIDEKRIISGSLPAGEYTLTVTAENALGRDTQTIRLEIAPDHLLLTPLLGFTSWNAFLQTVTQEDMLRTARLMDASGLAEYGYSYVNLDSAWQGEYGGEYDAIQPNDKFPDIRGMVDEIHALGFKAGIYSTPMRQAFGGTKARPFLPGCTRGEVDVRWSREAFGIGMEHCEAANAAQWADWGFDYLKYDWRPTDPWNADLMKQALLAAPRDIAFCGTVRCSLDCADYWKANCTSWRCNRDSDDRWFRLMEIFDSYDPWVKHISLGHYFDLDMLELGNNAMNVLELRDAGRPDIMDGPCRLSEDEQIIAFTMRAFLASPIQISSRLEKMGQFEMDLYCNDEILAVNQDALASAAVLVMEKKEERSHLKVYERALADGGRAVAFFNIGEMAETVALEKDVRVRDLCAKEDIGDVTLTLPPHTVRVVKYTK